MAYNTLIYTPTMRDLINELEPLLTRPGYGTLHESKNRQRTLDAPLIAAFNELSRERDWMFFFGGQGNTVEDQKDLVRGLRDLYPNTPLIVMFDTPREIWKNPEEAHIVYLSNEPHSGAWSFGADGGGLHTR